MFSTVVVMAGLCMVSNGLIKNSIFSFHLQLFNVDYFFIVFSEPESSEMLKNMNTRNDVVGKLLILFY
jgi:hypothetical protein